MSESVVSDRSRPVPWQCARIVAEENARDLASPNPSPVQSLVLWFKAVQLYHQAETGGAAAEGDRQMQKHMLSVLISTGEWLVSQLRQHDVTSKVDVTLADVEATLEEALRQSTGLVWGDDRGPSRASSRGGIWCLVMSRSRRFLLRGLSCGTARPSERAKWRGQRDALIDRAVHGTRSCPQELLEALWPRFRDYQLARRKEHQAKMAQNTPQALSLRPTKKHASFSERCPGGSLANPPQPFIATPGNWSTATKP